MVNCHINFPLFTFIFRCKCTRPLLQSCRSTSSISKTRDRILKTFGSLGVKADLSTNNCVHNTLHPSDLCCLFLSQVYKRNKAHGIFFCCFCCCCCFWLSLPSYKKEGWGFFSTQQWYSFRTIAPMILPLALLIVGLTMSSASAQACEY